MGERNLEGVRFLTPKAEEPAPEAVADEGGKPERSWSARGDACTLCHQGKQKGSGAGQEKQSDPPAHLSYDLRNRQASANLPRK